MKLLQIPQVQWEAQSEHSFAKLRASTLPQPRPELPTEIDVQVCAFYHGGSALLRSLRAFGRAMKCTKFKTTALAFLLAFPCVAAAQNVDDILAKVFAARGGLDKIKSMNSQRITGRISFGEISGPFLVELKRPLKMHMQLTVQNMTMVRVYDGKSQGWANNPFNGKMNPDAMSEDELKNINEESDFDGPLVDANQKGNKVELVGKDKVKDKDVWRLKLTTQHGDVRYYLYDADSFLLAKWEGKRKYEDKELPVETYFSDYREVNGLKFPFQLESGSSETDVSQKIVVEKLELNAQIDDSEFAKPAPPAPASSAPKS